ncbi:MAG: hypothetical protein WCO25_02070 [Candidatus Uhrbacteria bacterium]
MRDSCPNRAGFSVVEIILATALAGLFVASCAGGLLFGVRMSKEAGRKSQAVFLAEEGLEATQNIRDAAYSNLSAGTYGLTTTGNQWNLSGASDTTGIYTRTQTIAVVDATKKSDTSTVSWKEPTGQTRSVSLVTYFADWNAVTTTLGGLMSYGDGTTTPKYRKYDTTANSFGTQTATVVGSSGVTFVTRTSPQKTEAITGYVTAAGVLNVMCYDGATWTQEWSVTVGGTGTTRRFDIAYETSSGDVMVLYSTNAATTNEMAYRTKLGTSGCGTANWAAAANLDPVRTSGVVQWVKLAWDRRSAQNLITAIWADAASDLSAMVWSGTAWGNEPAAVSEASLEIVAAAQDVEDFDVEYESVSGDVMMVWANSAGSNGSNGVRYRVCTGGTSACAWGAVTTPPTFADDATNLDLSANPNTDEMVFASVGNAGSDMQAGYWSGAAWTDTANVDTSCNTPVAGGKIVSTGWLINGATTRSIVIYGDNATTNVDWYTGVAGVFTLQADVALAPAPTTPQSFLEAQMNPLSKDTLMYSIAENANDLYSKRVVMSAVPAFTWTNSDGAVLVPTLPQKITNPFSFAYWRL